MAAKAMHMTEPFVFVRGWVLYTVSVYFVLFIRTSKLYGRSSAIQSEGRSEAWA